MNLNNYFHSWKSIHLQTIQRERVQLTILMNRWRIYVEDIGQKREKILYAYRVQITRIRCRKIINAWSNYVEDEKLHRVETIRKEILSYRASSFSNELDFGLEKSMKGKFDIQSILSEFENDKLHDRENDLWKSTRKKYDNKENIYAPFTRDSPFYKKQAFTNTSTNSNAQPIFMKQEKDHFCNNNELFTPFSPVDNILSHKSEDFNNSADSEYFTSINKSSSNTATPSFSCAEKNSNIRPIEELMMKVNSNFLNEDIVGSNHNISNAMTSFCNNHKKPRIPK